MSDFVESKVEMAITPDCENRVLVMQLGPTIQFYIPVERVNSLIRDLSLKAQQILQHDALKAKGAHNLDLLARLEHDAHTLDQAGKKEGQ